MRLPKKDSLIEVVWFDIVGGINTRLQEITPQKCTTVGYLKVVDEKFIVIASSVYDGEGQRNPTVDGCAIPVGCITKVRKIT